VVTQAGPRTGASGAGPAPSASAKARDSGVGGVTVEASLASKDFLAAKGQGADKWGFLVSLDTHSVDLTGIDLVSRVSLRDGSGRVLKPAGWRPLSEDSHHRSGLLLFAADGAGEGILSGEKLKNVQLVFTDISGARERVLVWK
jgi:hypothetical protein